MSAYNVMKGQAGDRKLYRWKYENRPVVLSSHFATHDEFLDRIAEDLDEGDTLAWYEIDGQRYGGEQS
jgi:hypothetical protein